MLVLSKLKIYWTLFKKSPVRFRKWIELEEIKEKIIKAIEEKEQQFPDLVFEYLSIAFDVPKQYFEGRYWEEVMRWFSLFSVINLPPINLPLISTPYNKKSKKDDWDYPGRTWPMYCHLLAEKYGWSIEYIAKLTVTDALALVQEVLTDEQLNKEFLWGMSDKSATYDTKTKTTKFNDLPRPYWMKKKIEPPKKIIMPANLLPVGNVDVSAIPEEFKSKAVEP
jgi:hypothetical protein